MQGVPTKNVSSAGKKNNLQQQSQPSPTSVKDLTIDVNSPPIDRGLPSPIDSKSRRNRRRRKPKARGNQVEPVASPARNPNKTPNSTKNKSSHNNSPNNNSNHTSSPFCSPIVSWRSSRPRNGNNNSRHNTKNNKQWNHPSPRFSKNVSSPACPASTGFPTSKKQHDAPMKKRDLYFALHVERVGIAPLPENETQQQQKAVARVTLTNWENEIVLDTFVAIPVPVTDFYETGIRPEHVKPNTKSTNAIGSAVAEGVASDKNIAPAHSSLCFSEVRAKVEQMLRGKILIGHELDEGLQALGLAHPTTDMRDCSVYFSDERKPGHSSLKSLEELSRKELNRWSVKASKARVAKDISNKEAIIFSSKDHSISKTPVLVCVTSMDIYKKHRNAWETSLIVQARERERQQQEHLLKISEQRQQEQERARREAQQRCQQQYRDAITTVSMNCETVRTGRTKTLTRVTIVDGPSRNVVLDEFCQIVFPVTDFTALDAKIPGMHVPRHQTDNSCSSKPISVVRALVEQSLRGRLLVGYKVEEGLKALGLTHPWAQTRDIAYYPPFLRNASVADTSMVTVRPLDDLSEDFLRQQLRPVGDRCRPLDVCRTTLCLYEAVRDQWEGQQRDSYPHHVHPQHSQNLQPQQPGRMMACSPSASSVGMLHSPHHNHYNHQPNHCYGQQTDLTSYGGPTMILSPTQRQQYQPHVMEEQQQRPDMQSRSNPSSWFPWGKNQPLQENQVGGASQMLSPQAYQVLQEVSGVQYASFSPSKKSFFQDNSSVDSYYGNSSYIEGTSRYEESTVGGRSGLISETVATESLISSMPDESSSVISSDQPLSTVGSPRLCLKNDSPSSSSWFRFGSKKTKYPTSNDVKTNCETMAAVQEMEVLSDDGMLPTPTTLFSSKDLEKDNSKSEPKTDNAETITEGTAMSPSLFSRKLFGFRKPSISTGGKERSHSPSSCSSESTIDELSIAAEPEGFPDTATEASIEITLSIPNSTETEGGDTCSLLVEKAESTTLASRPSSSSWFGFRRSSKSLGSKCKNFPSDSLTKVSDPTVMPYHPGLPSAPTERTAAMEDDWLQEVMTGTTDDLSPWLNENPQDKAGEETGKSSATSRGQASWFGFKRGKVTSLNKVTPLTNGFDSIGGMEMNQDPRGESAWRSDSPKDDYWSAATNTPMSGSDEETLSTILMNANSENNNDESDIFRPRARLPTESTVPSVATEVASEEEKSVSDDCYSKELDFGAVESFNFLKI